MPANSRWDLIRRLRVNSNLVTDDAKLRSEFIPIRTLKRKFRRSKNNELIRKML